ncbi:LytR/AlgR family response regulator transcription factor [Spongiimicrobium sp. 3-5]|uniref:LytR/AlgR family response regulator transcription factor n=1 Tax=Spongiimicrobium sp. 3-5 TaxID=3332596 RepID=UPI00397FB7FE
MEYTYTIIDSDATSNLQLQHHLEEYGEFVCTGLAKNSVSGLNAILKHLPDVVFVNLNEKANEYFQMVMELHQYMNTMPIFIGISKSKQYAYEAIKNNFFDYWLQPYNEFDIRKSILRLVKDAPKDTDSHTLCLKSYKDFQYLDTNEILYLQADNNATDIVMKDGNTISAFKTLKTFENRLPKNFIRVHQSYIINTNYVSRINYGKSICSLKNGNRQLPFSKTYKENIDGLKNILSKSTISTLN